MRGSKCGSEGHGTEATSPGGPDRLWQVNPCGSEQKCRASIATCRRKFRPPLLPQHSSKVAPDQGAHQTSQPLARRERGAASS